MRDKMPPYVGDVALGPLKYLDILYFHKNIV